jgi:hypothetical protein
MGGVIAMTLIGSYLDQDGLVVSVSVEATSQGSYLVVRDRWRGPLAGNGAQVELEACAPGNARWVAECQVLMHGGQLHESAESLLGGRVLAADGQQALRDSRRRTRTLERFVHVPAPGSADGGEGDRSGRGS